MRRLGRSTPRLVPLKRRSAFLRAARGRRCVMASFVLQAVRRAEEDAVPTIGVGFTASRKIGKAVARNRAKRRLREAARRVLPRCGEVGYDYVLVARQAVLTCPFQDLERQLARALAGIRSQTRSKRSCSP